jgi:hypothetical protein
VPAARGDFPSTTLREVPLPIWRWGGRVRAPPPRFARSPFPRNRGEEL